MQKIDSSTFDPDLEPVVDKVHRIARAGIAAIPMLGGTSVELLNSIIAPPHEVRTTKWLHKLTEAVNLLIETYNINQESLSNNDKFFSAIIRSSDIALRTSEDTMLNALASGLVFSATTQDKDEAIITLYLLSLSRLTSLHLTLTKYIADLPPVDRTVDLTEEKQMQFYTELNKYDSKYDTSHLINRLMQDLVNEKIVEIEPGAMMSMRGPNYIHMRLSPFGKELVDFISSYPTEA
ncbi:hypothetical protein [Plesiomonas shigelloides]|uniref:hypothetical protein n=1 Tax=Plesiomonas shigelloides TaxID=703 RepID=UPI0012615F02|nr:hypothetical protein [Plesiomonas shigelloides]KAB7696304.1 hypothetical protein GBN15_10310 [Plesiomonas shigelloides]